MGYFSRNANAAFKDNPDGDGWLYYPNGASKNGYIVTNAQYKKRLFYFEKYKFLLVIILGVTYGLYITNHGIDIQAVAELTAFLLIIYILQYWLTKNLKKTDIPLTYNEAMSVKVTGIKTWKLYLYFALQLSVILMGITLPWTLDISFIEIYEIMLIFICVGLGGIAIVLHQQKYIKSNKANQRGSK